MATDAVGAKDRGATIATGAAVDTVSIPQIAPHQQEGNAGHDAEQQAIHTPTLAHLASIGIRVATKAAPSAKDCNSRKGQYYCNLGQCQPTYVLMVIHPLTVSHAATATTAQSVLPVLAIAGSLAGAFAPTLAFAHGCLCYNLKK